MTPSYFIIEGDGCNYSPFSTSVSKFLHYLPESVIINNIELRPMPTSFPVSMKSNSLFSATW